MLGPVELDGAISIAGRGHGLARDFGRLCEMSPMAEAFIEMHGTGA